MPIPSYVLYTSLQKALGCGSFVLAGTRIPGWRQCSLTGQNLDVSLHRLKLELDNLRHLGNQLYFLDSQTL